jgi:hypothetical protein
MVRKLPPLALAGLVAAGIVVLQALLVMWFAWPAEKAAPRDLPVVVAGPAQATRPVVDRLRFERPGAFAIGTAPDAAAADAALRDRTAYAAFVVERSGVSLHVASAASPTVSALLTQAAQQFGGGRPVTVVDVVATPTTDPRGAGFVAGFLPLLLTSMVCGIGLLLLVGSHRVRVVGLLAFAAFAGLVTAGVMHGLGVLADPYLAEAGAIGLFALAVATTVAGLGAALGNPGVGLGALLMFFVGNPISGIASAPELLPKPWGAIGQLLPPGAGASLLRSVSFFDGAAAAGPLWVLGAWALGGLALTAVGHFRDRATAGSHDDVAHDDVAHDDVAHDDVARDAAKRLGALHA